MNQIYKFKNYNINDKFYWGSLVGSSEALALVEFCQTTKSSILIIADDIASESILLRELELYKGHITVVNFANYEVLAYDAISPHQDIISNRIHTLNSLSSLQNTIIVTTLETLIMRVTPLEFIKKHSLSLALTDIIKIDIFAKKLIDFGYLRVETVNNKGEFSIKGSIIDIYVMGAKTAIRIDLFDNEVDSIRTFDVSTQRSIKEISSVNLLPAKEFGFDNNSINKFLTNHLQQFNNKNDVVYNAVSNKIIPQGIEFYLPLFFETTSSLLDYLPSNTIICYKKGISYNADNIYADINNHYTKANENINRAVLAIDKVFLTKERLFNKINQFKQIVWQTAKVESGYNFDTKILEPVKIQHTSLNKLNNFLQKSQQKILIACESLGRESILLDLLSNDLNINKVSDYSDFLSSSSKINIIICSIHRGFVSDNIIVITEEEIFGNSVSLQKRRKRAKHNDFNESIKSLIEIAENDLVVHENYGIGRYIGLNAQQFDNIVSDFIHIVYAGGAKLMVPIDDINLISRYSGVNIKDVQLHKLGTTTWDKTKKKAIESMRDVASELLEIYAKRELEKGFANNPPSDAYNSFVATFAFEETEDQQLAIEKVIQDMISDKPMDRLICGDVGFGKTEVAMRAAFLAVENNYQVAILVPTTLLANQHYKSFIDRFSQYAVNIAVLSRFQNSKQQIQIKQQLTAGKIDIIIGTHKLIQKDIIYKNLGLLIIDEEHRFGVSQKEKLKGLKAKCDILTMSATPIPRTLNLALGSLRDMSIINTPPKGRISIKTLISEWKIEVIKEACQRELHRAGQIFFLHNDIDSIDNMAEQIMNILPNAILRVAHGKMPNKELETIMSDFYHQKFQILICTTIIETGIDIPTANTIIINNADKFGLSQLHQLRGRVGRSHHKAYAYLLVKSLANITTNAKKRLEAIESLEELGAGFMLANHDLEIRGAGDILGESQSGKIAEIGFNLYYDLLEKTVKSLKNNKNITTVTSMQKVEIDTGISCIIASDYINDVHMRLSFYQRINQCINEDDIKDLQIELIDRFGLMPDGCKNLFASQSLKNLSTTIGVSKISIFNDRALIFFTVDAKINPVKIIKLIQTQPQNYKLKNQTTLIYMDIMNNDISRINNIYKLLQSLI